MSSSSTTEKGCPPEPWIGSVVFGALASCLFFWSAVLSSSIAELAFAFVVFGRLAYVMYCAWRDSYTNRETLSPPRAYSIPRRFSLGILFLLTSAAAILSAALSSLQLPPVAVLIALSFMGLVALSQVFFDRAPRHASMIIGSVAFPLFVLPAVTLSHDASSSLPHALFVLASCSFCGAGAGYLMGLFMGSVLLIADKLYLAFSRLKHV